MKKFFLKIARFEKTPFIILGGVWSAILIMNLSILLQDERNTILNSIFIFNVIFTPAFTIFGAIVSAYQILTLQYYWAGIVGFILNCIGPAWVIFFITGVLTGQITA